MIKRVKKALDKNIVHQQEVLVLGWGRRVMDVGLVAPKKGYDAILALFPFRHPVELQQA